MSNETTQIVESLSIDGPIGIMTALGLGVLLALVFAGLLWSQRRATGTGWAAVFWGLRLVAIGLVLWMLLEPSWLTRERTVKPQSVAVLVDTSQSMDVNDPPDTRQQRWMRSASGSSEADDPLVACDRAVVAVQAAIRRTGSARLAIQNHRAPKDIRQECEAMTEAVDRAVDHLEASIARMTGDAAENLEKAGRIVTLLEGNVGSALRDIDDALDDSSLSSATDLAESILSIEDDLNSIESRLGELTRSLEFATDEQAVLQVTENSGGLTRREFVANTLDVAQREVTEPSDSRLNVKAYRFDQQVAAVSPQAGWSEALSGLSANTNGTSGEGQPSSTNLSAALDQLGRAASSEAIRSAILITDGAHNDPDALSPQEIAQSLADIPVHVVPIGNTQVLRDALLYRVDAPAAVVEKDTILIDVIVTAFECADESSKLVLRQNGKKIDERELTFHSDRTDSRVTFQVEADELGRQEFELALEPLEDETSTTNNVAFLTVNVVTDTLRVLLVDRIARWEYRYLDQLFRRDESVEYEKLLFQPEVRATGKIAETGAVPRDVEDWANYDVVILGDISPNHFDQVSQEGLDEFVRTRGGHLIVIAGEENMPREYEHQAVMELLPVERGRALNSDEGLRVVTTPSANSHPVLSVASDWPASQEIWREQYKQQPLYALTEYSHPKPTAETLLAVESPGGAVKIERTDDRSPDHALLCWQQVGAGRVVYLSEPVTYRLRFRRGDRYHHRFWGQLMRWLTAAERAGGTQTVRIGTDRVRYDEGQPVAVTVRLAETDGTPVRGASLFAEATPQDGSASRVELVADENVPGRYLGAFPSLPPGAFRVTATGNDVDRLLAEAEDKNLAEARINVTQTGSVEQLNTRCNLTLLKQIAEVTGGQVVPPTAIDELLMLSTLAPEVSEREERQPLWNRWSFLAIAFSCLCTEWIVRKRLGLV
ncbi:MAG: hypothetical protein R3C02_23440 [Planctomycetaceae bacterium]